MQITMDGKQAVQLSKLTRDIGADVMIPIYNESWAHFTEDREDLVKVLSEELFLDKVVWTIPGVPKVVY